MRNEDEMRGHDIVSGQRIDAATAERARQLRRRMTEAEETVWQAVRANRLHGLHFRRQQIVDGFIVDFYCHAAGLVVDVDGPIHERQTEADRERDAILMGRGLHVLHLTNDEVLKDLPGVLARIWSAVREFPLPPRGRGPGG